MNKPPTGRLKHAEWNGWTPTDLVFPFFLFIVGVSMAFSFSSRLKRGETRPQLIVHVMKRGLILLALGIFLNGFPNHYHVATWRFYGILQRIAIFRQPWCCGPAVAAGYSQSSVSLPDIGF